VGSRGLADQLLARAGSGLPPAEQERAFFTALEATGGAHLEAVPGLGPAGQARILAAWEIGRRYAHYRVRPRVLATGAPLSSSPLEALRRVPAEARLAAQEWLGFVAVYRGGDLGNLCIVDRGARTHVNTDATEFFARLLALRPAAFYLIHNHPSGRLQASPEDIQLTETIGQMAGSFGISLRGHWIVSPDGEYWIKPPAM
jgi:DNA repair protein RadC